MDKQGTTVQVYQFEDHERIRKGLIDFSDVLEKRYPTTALGVMKYGWSSPKFDTQIECTCPELLEVVDFFATKLGDGFWNLQPWFNVLRPGGSIGYHNHAGADFAAVYHIEGGGDLILDHGDKVDLLAPVPGRMAVFPGELYHSVPQVPGARRISLAINAYSKRPR